MKHYFPTLLLLCTLLLASCFHNDEVESSTGRPGLESDRISKLGIEHVIHISVDGLHPAAITTQGRSTLPAFYRMRDQGAYTDNARTDASIAYTLPNHASQMTGRPVYGDNGHGWVLNYGADYFGTTVHKNKGEYVSSVFDVVHDFGLSTALYVSKAKFVLFDDSWDENSGAFDKVVPDSGRKKIDKYVFNADTEDLVSRFVSDLADEKYNYAFLHLRDPDSAGHSDGWSLDEGSEYLSAVQRVDSLLMKILDFVEQNNDFRDATVIILTADHGGEFGTKIHLLSRKNGYLDSGVVPFYIYGHLIPADEDIYTWDTDTLADPGNSHPLNTDVFQPVRNAEAANLALEFLGLPDIPGSSINRLNFPYY